MSMGQTMSLPVRDLPSSRTRTPLLSARNKRGNAKKPETPGLLKQKINGGKIEVTIQLPGGTLPNMKLYPNEPVHQALKAALDLAGEIGVGFDGKEIVDDGSTFNDHGITDHSQVTVTGGGIQLQERIVLRGHGHWVFAVVCLKDGRLASASADKTVRIWDIAKGKCVKVLSGHEGGVTGVLELNSGLLASCSYDSTIRLWDLINGKEVRALDGHDDTILCLLQLSDGRLVSGSADGTARIWPKSSIASGRMRKSHGSEEERPVTLQGHSQGITSMAELRSGALATSSDDNTVRLWDTKTGKMKKVLFEAEAPIMGLTALLDGRLAVSCADSSICFFSSSGKPGPVLDTYHAGPVSKLLQLSAGHLGVTSSFDHTMKLWDLETGRCLQCLAGHTDGIYSVVEVFGEQLASCSTDMTIRIWG